MLRKGATPPAWRPTVLQWAAIGAPAALLAAVAAWVHNCPWLGAGPHWDSDAPSSAMRQAMAASPFWIAAAAALCALAGRRVLGGVSGPWEGEVWGLGVAALVGGILPAAVAFDFARQGAGSPAVEHAVLCAQGAATGVFILVGAPCLLLRWLPRRGRLTSAIAGPWLLSAAVVGCRLLGWFWSEVLWRAGLAQHGPALPVLLAGISFAIGAATGVYLTAMLSDRMP